MLVAFVSSLVAAVWIDLPSLRLPDAPRTAISAQGSLPPVTYAIRQAETRNAVQLQAAFDRIGFDLDAVAQGYISVPRLLLSSLPPDIDDLDAMADRKGVFIRTLLPVVLKVNDQIGADRQRLLAIRDKLNGNIRLSGEEVQWVLTLADAYDQADGDIEALVKKVDVIPPSLALAQAIEESGWGTSRIARERNAPFGQFAQGTEGDWDYRNFVTLTEAAASYAHNLNTHRAYRDFRRARSLMRSGAGDINGKDLAATLHRYSERGGSYVDTLRRIIRENNLESFDSARLNRQSVATIIASN